MKNYTAEEKKKIDKILTRLLKKHISMNWSYRHMGILFEAGAATVWKWCHGKSYPSEFHLLRVQNFIKELK